MKANAKVNVVQNDRNNAEPAEHVNAGDAPFGLLRNRARP